MVTRILGIDPGLRITGFGVIEQIENKLSYIASGTIKTSHLPTGDLPARIKIIAEGISSIQQKYQAHQAALEIVFINLNPQSSLMLGQARGAALSSLVMQQLPVSEYTALQVKKAITGNGRATKQQIQTMVMHLLSLSAQPSADAADALAIAITHANASKITKQIKQSEVLNRRASAMYKKGRYY